LNYYYCCATNTERVEEYKKNFIVLVDLRMAILEKDLWPTFKSTLSFALLYLKFARRDGLGEGGASNVLNCVIKTAFLRVYISLTE
jgi:hypothetical protein